ncbi:MAG: Wzz/FepE/Etk N-terminal domain-containing protein, partial [Acidobacteriota bacterium]
MPDNDQDHRIDHNRQYPIRPQDTYLPPSPYVGNVRNAYYEPREEVNLRDYVSVILKRKWIVLSFLVSVVVSTVVFTALMIPQYKSTVVLKISRQSPSALSFEGLNVMRSAGPDDFETQQDIIKSRAIADRVIRRLNLDKTKGFIPPEGKIDKMIGMITGPIEKAVTRLMSSGSRDSIKQESSNVAGDPKPDPYKPQIPVYLSGSLISRLEVKPVQKSELLQVSFSSQDPGIAADVANAVADEYISYDLDSRVNAGMEAKEFLERQIEKTEAKVQASEK